MRMNDTQARPMAHAQGTVFILWADRFDEAAAAIFVSVLREAGVRVKVVGLSAQRAVGAHGLALVPDMTLEQALPLAGRAVCVVVPADGVSTQAVGQDPRLREFLGSTATHGARFIVGPGNGWLTNGQGLLPRSGVVIEEYSATEDVVAYARGVGGALAGAK